VPSKPAGGWTRVGLAGIALLGLALLLPRLGTGGLWDPWEPRYAQTAQNMLERGDWVVPVYRGDPRLNKPPLTYWIIAVSRALGGPSEFATRAPIALLAAACPVVLAAALFALRRRLEAFVAGAALLTAPQWTLVGRFATPDVPLAASLGLVLAAALAWPAAGGAARRAWGTAVVLGLVAAALTDWPRGLLLALWAVLGWGALELGWKGVLALVAVAGAYHAGQLTYGVGWQVASFAGAVLAAAIALRVRGGIAARTQLAVAALVALLAAPWFVAAWRAAPGEMSLFEYKHALNLGESPGAHTGPYLYPLRVAAVGCWPWVGAAAVGLAAALSRRAGQPERRLAGAWIGALLFFSLSEAQMGHFYGVTQPALAGLAGIGVARLLRERDRRDLVLGVAALGAVLWVVWDEPARILETATVKSALHDLARPLWPWTLAGAAWVAALAAAWIRRRPGLATAAALPAAALAAWLGMSMLPALEATKSTRPLWRSYLEERRGEDPVGLIREYKDSTLYYGQGHLARLRTDEDLELFLSGPGEKFVIGSAAACRRLGLPPWTGAIEILDDRHPELVLARHSPNWSDVD